MSKKIIIYHQIFDLYDCAPKTLNNIKSCYDYLNKLADILGLKKISPPILVYTDKIKYPDKAGLSGWIPLIDLKARHYGGISIHTVIPTRFVSIDIYTTKDFDHKETKDYTVSFFKSKKIEEKLYLRQKNK